MRVDRLADQLPAPQRTYLSSLQRNRCNPVSGVHQRGSSGRRVHCRAAVAQTSHAVLTEVPLEGGDSEVPHDLSAPHSARRQRRGAPCTLHVVLSSPPAQQVPTHHHHHQHRRFHEQQLQQQHDQADRSADRAHASASAASAFTEAPAATAAAAAATAREGCLQHAASSHMGNWHPELPHLDVWDHANSHHDQTAALHATHATESTAAAAPVAQTGGASGGLLLQHSISPPGAESEQAAADDLATALMAHQVTSSSTGGTSFISVAGNSDSGSGARSSRSDSGHTLALPSVTPSMPDAPSAGVLDEHEAGQQQQEQQGMRHTTRPQQQPDAVEVWPGAAALEPAGRISPCRVTRQEQRQGWQYDAATQTAHTLDGLPFLRVSAEGQLSSLVNALAHRLLQQQQLVLSAAGELCALRALHALAQLPAVLLRIQTQQERKQHSRPQAHTAEQQQQQQPRFRVQVDVQRNVHPRTYGNVRVHKFHLQLVPPMGKTSSSSAAAAAAAAGWAPLHVRQDMLHSPGPEAAAAAATAAAESPLRRQQQQQPAPVWQQHQQQDQHLVEQLLLQHLQGCCCSELAWMQSPHLQAAAGSSSSSSSSSGGGGAVLSDSSCSSSSCVASSPASEVDSSSTYSSSSSSSSHNGSTIRSRDSSSREAAAGAPDDAAAQPGLAAPAQRPPSLTLHSPLLSAAARRQAAAPAATVGAAARCARYPRLGAACRGVVQLSPGAACQAAGLHPQQQQVAAAVPQQSGPGRPVQVQAPQQQQQSGRPQQQLAPAAAHAVACELRPRHAVLPGSSGGQPVASGAIQEQVLGASSSPGHVPAGMRGLDVQLVPLLADPGVLALQLLQALQRGGVARVGLVYSKHAGKLLQAVALVQRLLQQQQQQPTGKQQEQQQQPTRKQQQQAAKGVLPEQQVIPGSRLCLLVAPGLVQRATGSKDGVHVSLYLV